MNPSDPIGDPEKGGARHDRHQVARALRGACLALLTAASCSVPMGDDLHFRCDTNFDCGGDGFVCVTRKDGAQVCCRPTGAEVCGDQIDNDCDGLTDGEDSWPEEACNGIDDNCDGHIDETFFFDFQEANCGSCTIRCASTETCFKGTCIPALP